MKVYNINVKTCYVEFEDIVLTSGLNLMFLNLNKKYVVYQLWSSLVSTRNNSIYYLLLIKTYNVLLN